VISHGARRVLLAAILVLTAGASPLWGQTVAQRATATAMAVTHVGVVEVRAGRVVPNRTVFFADGHITAIRAALPADSALRGAIDGRGRFLIPGLTDMHAHFDGPPALFVANGITSVRKMMGFAADAQYRRDVAAGRILGPRLVQDGTPLLEGPHPIWDFGLQVESPTRGRTLVDSLHGAGYDFIKVYQSLPRETYLAIAAEARARRIPIAGHLPFEVGAEEASRVGQRSIEHLFGLGTECSTRSAAVRREIAKRFAAATSENDRVQVMLWNETLSAASYDSARCLAVGRTLARMGTWVVPTLVLNRGLAASPDDREIRDDPRLQYTSPEFRRLGDAPWIGEYYRIAFERDLRLVRDLRAAGAGLLAGSDCGNPFVVCGFSLHDELALLVRAGLTTAEALRAATSSPARFFGADSLGEIAPGKVADLVLLDGDPLADIRNVSRIRAVISAGRVYERSALDSILADVRRRVNLPPHAGS